MIFANTFDGLTPAQVAELDAYFDGYDYRSSGYTYLANYIWRNTHRLSWQMFGDYLCVGCEGSDSGEEPETDDGEPFCYVAFPLTRDGEYEDAKLKESIEAVRMHCAKAGTAMAMGVPGGLVSRIRDLYGDAVTIEHQRDDDDYVYLREDLVNLAGRKLHQKRNHLNYFQRTYTYTYEEITPQTLPEVRAFLLAANEEKLPELPPVWRNILRMESLAIGELLTFVGSGRLLTGAIRIGGQIQAATIGEFARTNSHETVIVHIEKASEAYRGLYQAINNEFCRHLPEDVVYINREEDMGMENLRQTKMSYKPCCMAEKYSVTWKTPLHF